MGLRDVMAVVGAERYEQAREWAWATAAGTGRTGADDPDAQWPSDVVDVPHDLPDAVWEEGAAAWSERVALVFALYRDMPCYATLMYTRHYFREWDDAARRLFWHEYRALLSDDDDRLADPVAYSLWCDYFEDPATVGEAWRELAAPGALTDVGLRRLLEVSGPVPYALKVPLYERLLAESRWHPHIFTSLMYSAFDVSGQVDAKAAERLLHKLRLPDDTEGLQGLRHKLDTLTAPSTAPKPGRGKKRRR